MNKAEKEKLYPLYYSGVRKQREMILSCKHFDGRGYQVSQVRFPGRIVHCCEKCWNESVHIFEEFKIINKKALKVERQQVKLKFNQI